MNLEGPLELGRLAGVLRELYVGRRTGVLRLAGAAGERQVFWREGQVLGAASAVPAEDLGEQLVRGGLLTPVDLQRARHLVAGNGLRLDAALLELDALAPAQLAPAVAAHARDVLLRAFADQGRYSFTAGLSEDASSGPSCNLPTGQIVLDSVRRLDDPDVVRHGLGDVDRPLALSTDPLLRFQRLELTPTDGYVLSRIDGMLSAREIAQLTPLPADDVLRSLLGLVSTGMVVFLEVARPARARGTETPSAPAPPTPAAPRRATAAAPSPPTPTPATPAVDPGAAERRREVLELYAGLRTRTHFELLELGRDAGEAEVKAAYFRQARRFHPDHHDPALNDLRDKLEAIFIRVGQAYDVLKNVHSRRAYEARLPRVPTPLPAAPAATPTPAPATSAAPAPAASNRPATPPPSVAAIVEASLRKAEEHMVGQRYWDAIQILEGALPRAEGRALQRGRVMLARALLKNPHWVRRAEETLLLAVRDEPPMVDAYVLLGRLYKERNLRARAVSMYRKAVELKPDQEEALAALTELVEQAPAPEEEAPPEKPGILKKFFGRKP